MLSLALAAVLAQKPLVVVEHAGPQRRIVLAEGARETELGTYPAPATGGNLPFSFDLSADCRLLRLRVVTEQGKEQHQVVETALSDPARPGKVRFSSESPLTNPRWAPTGDSFAIVEGGQVRVIDEKGRSAVASPGTQLSWRADGSLLVHQSERVTARAYCHDFAVAWVDGAAPPSRVCGGHNAWLPAAGTAPPEMPPVILELFAVAGAVQLSTVEGDRVAATVTAKDSTALQQGAVACERGVSYPTQPVVSLARQGTAWKFVNEDVCGIGALAAGGSGPRPLKVQRCGVAGRTR